jgi:hypothetical protein
MFDRCSKNYKIPIIYVLATKSALLKSLLTMLFTLIGSSGLHMNAKHPNKTETKAAIPGIAEPGRPGLSP